MVIAKMMHAVFRVLKIRMGEQTDAKLTMEQLGLLFAINQEQDDVIQKDMAEIMGKDKSAILRMVDSLESKDLVRRVVNKNDRRKNHIMVSKKGERIIRLYREAALQLNNELMSDLPPSDLEAFYRVIDHIRNKAEQLL